MRATAQQGVQTTWGTISNTWSHSWAAVKHHVGHAACEAQPRTVKSTHSAVGPKVQDDEKRRTMMANDT